jgi:excinuclease UvrABC nuclease subunit
MLSVKTEIRGWNQLEATGAGAPPLSPLLRQGGNQESNPFFDELSATLPASAAVFILRGPDPASEPYVSKTSNLRRRMQRLLGAPAEGSGKRLNLRGRVRWLEYQRVGSDFEATLLLYRVLREEFPRGYQERLRLRPAPLLKLILDNPYPRLAFTSRISSLRGNNLYYGPFATRAAAEQFANDSLDFFKHRRCTDDLNPDPSFPGCVYSEMKMCMAPCFKGCTDEEYAAETARVQRYLDTGGNSLKVELVEIREKASEQLEFESAAAAHARIEKLQGVRQQLPEIVRRLDQLRGLMVQPSHEPESVTLFKIEQGMFAQPVQLKIAGKQTVGEIKTPQSMESRIAEALATVESVKPSSAQEWMEHLTILKRWFYRTSKTGELFLSDPNGELPMRRIVRGVSRVFKGEKPQADLSESARDYWINRGKETGLQE